jgi:hypothetical protein
MKNNYNIKNISLNSKINISYNSISKIKSLEDERINLKKNKNFINKKSNLSLDSRNLLLIDKYDKFCETNNDDETEKKGTNANIKNNNNISALHKYKKEPIIITQKINNIKYPNTQMVKKIDKKNDLFQSFLERHNIILNNSPDKRKKVNNKFNYTISNRFYGTSIDFHKKYDQTFSNYFHKIENKNIKLLRKENNFNVNDRTVLTQSNKRKRIYNIDIPNSINYKIISLDNKYHTPLNDQKNRTRNKIEILLPITNIFETFQVNKYKNIVNNITEDFPTKITPIFGRTGYSIYNKSKEKYKTIKNINIYKKKLFMI